MNKKTTDKNNRSDEAAPEPEQKQQSEQQPEQQPGKTPGPEQTVSDEPEIEAAVDEAIEEGIAERLLRLQADFDNYRRRMQKERADWFARANEDLIEELLPVLDHFEMGLNVAREHNTESSVIEGFKLVYDQLMATLKKNNVTVIDAVKQEFNPHLHEAVTYMPSDDVPAEHVVDQLRKGYLLGDKLLRPAQVVISSGPADSAE